MLNSYLHGEQSLSQFLLVRLQRNATPVHNRGHPVSPTQVAPDLLFISYMKIVDIDIKIIFLLIVCKIFYVVECWYLMLLLLLFVCYSYFILKFKPDASIIWKNV